MKRNYFKGISLALALTAFFAVYTAPAGAIEVKLSGQVNQMVMWTDDGDESSFFITDNDNSSTRLSFTGEEDFQSVKAGFKIEMEAQRNASNKLTIDQEDDGAFEFNERWLNIYFKTEFGTFEIGKGDGAANNTTETDLSGTTVINNSDAATTASSFVWKSSDGTAFRNSGSDEEPDYLTVGDTRNNFDGLSRNERFRYVTPEVAGFSASASMANGEAWELGGYYDLEFSDHKLAAAFGYVDGGDREDYTQWGASISFLAAFGFNITAAYGSRDVDEGQAATNMYAKIGYLRGIHAISIDYGVTADLSEEDDKSSNYGIAYVIKPWKGVELYGAYRIYMLDAAGEEDDPEDISQMMAGTRIKF